MPLSKHYLDLNTQTICFDCVALGTALREGIPEIEFALLMGSAKDGVVKPHSDIDIALYLRQPVTFLLYNKVEELVIKHLGSAVRVDIGILNRADPVYRFEALKGRLLFFRNDEIWLHFYSVTCREFETQMFHYERQRHYRLERGIA
jgi:predicted nucleotidyltransferase